MAGYSSTPLAKKLGIKEGSRIGLVNAPKGFQSELGELPDNAEFGNAFKVQWELFLKHVACDEPFPWDFLEGAKGVQLAELGLRSWQERRWLEVPELSL